MHISLTISLHTTDMPSILLLPHRAVFEKLHKFIGKNIKALVAAEGAGGAPHCLRLQKNRVFYVREDVMRRATNVSLLPGLLSLLLLPAAERSCVLNARSAAERRRREAAPGSPACHPCALARVPPMYACQVARDKLVALGACIGKFTHSGKFRLTIGALDLLAQYAKYKVGCGANEDVSWAV